MKKGELKKQEILQTAETLFCKNGFEATSVQDILDILKTSKGSFYHHFVSKESVLEEICSKRVESGAEAVIQQISESNRSVIQSLNILLSGIIPIQGERLQFLLMLLPVFRMTEGVQIKNRYCVELSKTYSPLIEETVRKGMEEEVFFCSDATLGAYILCQIVNDYWMKICDMILEKEEIGQIADPTDLLYVTDFYRETLERILFAPYGSIHLTNIPELQALTGQIHLHWKK